MTSGGLQSLLFILSKDNNHDDDDTGEGNDPPILYNDFDDFFMGKDDDPDGRKRSWNDDQLSERLRLQKNAQIYHERLYQNNWEHGNWDESLGFQGTATGQSSISAMTSYEEEDEGITIVWVGDDRGQILAFQKSIDTPIMQRTHGDEDDDDDAEKYNQQQQQQRNFRPWKTGPISLTNTTTPISALAVDPDGTLFVAAGNQIFRWDASKENPLPVHLEISSFVTTLHPDTIGFLRVLSVLEEDDDEGNHSFLVSSCGNMIALWNASTGQLLGRIKQEHTSIDVNAEYMFVGLASGETLAYSIHKILSQQQQEDDADPKTGIIARWRASDKTITALRIQTCCSTDNNNNNNNNNKGQNNAGDNLLVYTGDAGGTIKRFQMLKQRDGTLQPWPRIPTQKLANAAHLFSTTATSSAITSIVTVDDTKFMAGYSNGSVRVWNVRYGRELFRMEGFESNLQSLLVIPNIAVTGALSESTVHTLVLIPNGKIVAVQDFGIEEDEDFDLDMPEYLQHK
jgi:hypothetical protein